MIVTSNNDKLNALTCMSPNIKAFITALDNKSDFIAWGRLDRDNMKMSDGTYFKITQSIRSASEQVSLFEKGRKKVEYKSDMYLFPNEFCKKTPARKYELLSRGIVADSKKVVTNAFAGESYHNWGLAVDIVLNRCNYNTSWKFSDGEMSMGGYFSLIGLTRLAKSCGLSWGGDWVNFPDIWHFEDDNYMIPNKDYWYSTNMNFSFLEEQTKTNNLPAVVGGGGLSKKSLIPLSLGIYGIYRIFKRR